MPIYYEDQTGWTKGDFCYLHRYLHRLFYYYNKHEMEISQLDVDRMTNITRVLIYCIIVYYHYDFLFSEYNNLAPLKDTKSLEKKLVLDDGTLQEDDIYKKMNIVY